MSTAIRPVAVACIAVTLVGLLAGVGSAAWQTARNDWRHFELTNLFAWMARRASLSSIVGLLAIWVAIMSCRYLLHRVSSNSDRAARAFGICLAASTAAVAAIPVGYSLNRYVFKELWAQRNAEPILGLEVPVALLSPKVLLANLAVVFGAALLGLLVLGLLPPIEALASRLSQRGARHPFVPWLAAVSTPVVVLVLVFYEGPSDRSKPNVILISADTLRADHLSCYGYGRRTSPALDAFARKGILFENAIAAADWTLPSHLSIMTSQLPSVHGVRTKEQRLPAFKVTLAEILRNAGYRTKAITGGYFVDSRFGFDQGFDDYEGDSVAHLAIDEKRRYGQGVRLSYQLPRAIRWLDRNRHRPSFLFLHFWDAHAPYMPHEGYIEQYSPDYAGPIPMVTHELGRQFKEHPNQAAPADVDRTRALYDNEIRYMDEFLGRFLHYLEASGFLAKSIVVFTSDHGDELLEHGSGHGWSLYEPEIRVPLVIVSPGRVPAGLRIGRVVSGIDILPTILDLAGVSVSESVGREIQGLSLSGAWEEQHLPTRRFAVSEGYHHPDVCLRTDRFKYFRRMGRDGVVSENLFDLAADPAEHANQIDSLPSVAAALRDQLSEYIDQSGSVRFAGASERLELDKGTRERLRALGYVD